MKKWLFVSLISTTFFTTNIHSESISTSLDYAQVIFVEAKQSSDNTWCFNTTVRHNDESWDHYANAWQVEDLQGNQIAERVLFHPHVTEQPFTRSLCQINVPSNISQVVVRAKCNLHGFGGKSVTLDLTSQAGQDYTVKHFK